MREADHSSQIDTEKLGQLAGFSSGKSANASWLVIKKKLLSGATFDPASTTTTPKKVKGKAAANGDTDEDNEGTLTTAASKKRDKAIKTEATEAEGGDADTKKTPTAETPKKGRAKKGTAASKTDVTGDADNNTAATVTPAPKRKRGPNKPKDPNATPAKRTKKGANAAKTTATVAQANEGGSIFGGDTDVKKEEVDEEGGDNHPLDAEEQAMANHALMPDVESEGQVA